MNYNKGFIFLFIVNIAIHSSAWAWGGRGHTVICEVATQLVKNKELKNFLTLRPQVLAYICNLPDIYWKSSAAGKRDLEGPTHWFDPEVIGAKIPDVPLDYSVLVSTYTGKQNLFWPDETITSVPSKVGSLWWRADQFYRLASGTKPDFVGAIPPQNTKEEQDEKSSYNNAVYKMMLYMGLLGHYVGDASMPHHSSADHDGWKSGHGGIHFYYEDLSVGQFPADLQSRVYKAAIEMQKKAKALKFMQGNVLERMRHLSDISAAEIPDVHRLDPMIKKSEMENKKENKPRVPAERKSAEVGYKLYKDRIITELARSSLLLATLWDEIYVATGQPPLSKYRFYRFPYTVDHIAPDYFDIKK